ncbi:hypothetical protein ACTSKR_13580 [Chitinibacteraceae bacterium HSL-7]
MPFVVTARPSSLLPASLRQSDAIRQALGEVRSLEPNDFMLDNADLATLSDASRILARRLDMSGKLDVPLQFRELCDISSELFRKVRAIRQDVKDIISDHEGALEDNCVGALKYVSDFRTEMAPAIARSIFLRRFANYVDAVILAQILYSTEDMEIELHIGEQ